MIATHFMFAFLLFAFLAIFALLRNGLCTVTHPPPERNINVRYCYNTVMEEVMLMVAMNTEQLLRTALDLAGWENAPPDSGVRHPGSRINHVLIGIDLDVGDLFMARQLGYHAVIDCRSCSTAGGEEGQARAIAWMESAGLPSAVAIQHQAEREVQQQLTALALNMDRLPSVARLLDLPYICLATPMLDFSRRILQDAIAQAGSAGLVQSALADLPGFAAPMLLTAFVAGSPSGSSVVLPDDDFSLAHSLFSHGVATVCLPATSTTNATELTTLSGNVVLLPRIAFVAAGIAPLLTTLRAAGIEITAFSGL